MTESATHPNNRLMIGQILLVILFTKLDLNRKMATQTSTAPHIHHHLVQPPLHLCHSCLNDIFNINIYIYIYIYIYIFIVYLIFYSIIVTSTKYENNDPLFSAALRLNAFVKNRWHF